MAMDHGGDESGYRWQDLAADTPVAIREALELPARMPRRRRRNRCESSAPGRRAARPVPGELLLEDGRSLRLAGQLPADLPLGYHDFFPDGRRAKTRLIVTPGQCLPPPSQPQWGWVVQLYAARSAQSWGIGDLADLRRLASWAAGQHADLLMLSPLGAAAPTIPQAASPYYPSSRRFRNPLYLRVEEVPAERLGPRLGQLAAAGQALQVDRRIDRDAVFRLKQEALKAIWAGGPPDAAFDDYCRQQGAPAGRVCRRLCAGRAVWR